MNPWDLDRADPGGSMRAELAAEDAAARRRQRALLAHPRCDDPAHVGCERCQDTDEPADLHLCGRCPEWLVETPAAGAFQAAAYCAAYDVELIRTDDGLPLRCRACRNLVSHLRPLEIAA